MRFGFLTSLVYPTEFRPTLATFKYDLTIVECFEFRAMADTYERDCSGCLESNSISLS